MSELTRADFTAISDDHFKLMKRYKVESWPDLVDSLQPRLESSESDYDLMRKLKEKAESRNKVLTEALEEVVYVLGDDPNNREWEVRLVKHARKALTGSKPIQGEK